MEIERLRKELEAHEAMLEVFDRHMFDEKKGPETKYRGVPPRVAIYSILGEAGKPLPQAEILDLVVAGGGTIGKKRDQKQPNNARISIEKLLANGKLKMIGELIGLPEWDEGRFSVEKHSQTQSQKQSNA